MGAKGKKRSLPAAAAGIEPKSAAAGAKAPKWPAPAVTCATAGAGDTSSSVASGPVAKRQATAPVAARKSPVAVPHFTGAMPAAPVAETASATTPAMAVEIVGAATEATVAAAVAENAVTNVVVKIETPSAMHAHSTNDLNNPRHQTAVAAAAPRAALNAAHTKAAALENLKAAHAAARAQTESAKRERAKADRVIARAQAATFQSDNISSSAPTAGPSSVTGGASSTGGGARDTSGGAGGSIPTSSNYAGGPAVHSGAASVHTLVETDPSSYDEGFVMVGVSDATTVAVSGAGMGEMRALLMSIKLDKYADIFEEQGYDDVPFLQQNWDTEQDALVKQTGLLFGHARKLADALRRTAEL